MPKLKLLILVNQGEGIIERLKRTLKTAIKLIGMDVIFMVIPPNLKNFFDLFPEVCFINGEGKDLVFSLYKGLRKLRGSDVLILDASKELKREEVVLALKERENVLFLNGGRWSGLAKVLLRDVDYLIRASEECFGKDLRQVFKKAKELYGIPFKEIDDKALLL